MKKEFYCERTQKPFENCSVCKKALGSSLYFIEKVMAKNQDTQSHFVLFEYAICSSCREDMMEEVSDESKQAIQQFMDSQQDDIIHLDSEDSLSFCAFTGKAVQGLNEYNRIGVFQNDKEVVPSFVISGEIKEAYQEILSKKTKDFFDDFFNDFIDIPPALAKVLDKNIKPVLF